jgi:hypothetical protein
MALQTFPNDIGVLVSPLSELSAAITGANTSTSGLINATGESVSVICKLHIDGRGSKLLSSAGGKIHWVSGSTTFANAGTTLRVGVQDVVSGLEDGTFDVYADLVGATDTIASSTIMATAMETGSKTINHNDLIAISWEMTARAGADSLAFTVSNTIFNFPYRTEDVGAGPVKADSQIPLFVIEFDDGTLGWAFPTFVYTTAGISYSSSSTPDEYALVFRMPINCTMSCLQLSVGNIASTDDFEVIIYSDPLGTPVAEETIAYDPDWAPSPFSTQHININITPFSLIKDTDYAIAVRPTTTNAIIIPRLNFGTGNAHLRRTTMLGTNWSMGSRSNQTGAFTQDTEKLPQFNFYVNQLHDGEGGGGTSHTF